MEEDVPQLSTDSFVDTVANTVGMLIVFTVITVATTHRRAAEVDPELEKLHRRRGDVERAEKELPRIEAEIAAKQQVLAGLTSRHVDATKERDRARAAHDSARGILEALVRRERGLAANLEELEAAYRRDSSDVARAEEEQRRAATELAPAELSLLERRSPDELGAELDTLVSETRTLASEAGSLAQERVRLAESERSLRERKALLGKTIAEMSEAGLVRLSVRAPPGTDAYRNSIWVECFVQPGRGPCVRPIDDRNYAKEPAAPGPRGEPRYVLKAILEGEELARALEPDSAFRRHLAERAKLKATHCVQFLVRPDAYAAFFALRKAVREDGWDVRWEPIEAGESISM